MSWESQFFVYFLWIIKAIFGLEIYTSFIKTFRLKWNYHLKVNTWNTILKYIKHLLLQTNTALQIDYHNNDNICQWINEEKHNITDNKGFCSWNEKAVIQFSTYDVFLEYQPSSGTIIAVT